MGLLRRILALGRQSRMNREIDEELRAHIQMRSDDNLAAGMEPDAAARDARLRFGNATAVKEKVMAIDAALAFEALVSDVSGAVWLMHAHR